MTHFETRKRRFETQYPAPREPDGFIVSFIWAVLLGFLYFSRLLWTTEIYKTRVKER